MSLGKNTAYLILIFSIRFWLHGYVAAYILPECFETDSPGVEYAQQEKADYAVITVYDPFVSSYERIGGAYKMILEHLQANSFREKPRDNVISCFEYVYEKDGMTCMEVYILTEGVSRSDAFTNYS